MVLINLLQLGIKIVINHDMLELWVREHVNKCAVILNIIFLWAWNFSSKVITVLSIDTYNTKTSRYGIFGQIEEFFLHQVRFIMLYKNAITVLFLMLPRLI